MGQETIFGNGRAMMPEHGDTGLYETKGREAARRDLAGGVDAKQLWRDACKRKAFWQAYGTECYGDIGRAK